MPIGPDNMAKYPGGSIRSHEWLAIRERISERAGDCCEGCGIANRVIGIRIGDDFHVSPPGDLGARVSIEVDGIIVGGKVIQIVCTVAHIDGKLDDHSDANLAFWCQRCHLRHDARQHKANAAITRAEKAGQIDLFGRR